MSGTLDSIDWQDCDNFCGTGGGIPWSRFTTNCTLSAAFLGPLFKTGNVNLPALFALVRNLWPGVSEDMSDVFVLAWFACATQCDTSRTNLFLVDRPAEHCEQQVCRAIGYDGNADIAGVGVSISISLRYTYSWGSDGRSIRSRIRPCYAIPSNLLSISSVLQNSKRSGNSRTNYSTESRKRVRNQLWRIS